MVILVLNPGPGGIKATRISKSDKTVLFARNDAFLDFRTLFSKSGDYLGVLRGSELRITHLF